MYAGEASFGIQGAENVIILIINFILIAFGHYAWVEQYS